MRVCKNLKVPKHVRGPKNLSTPEDFEWAPNVPVCQRMPGSVSGLARPFFHKVKWAMALMTSTGNIFRLSFKTEAPAADCFGYVSNIGCPPKSWCPFGLFSRPNPTQDEEKNHQISSKSWECVRISNTLFPQGQMGHGTDDKHW